MSYFGVNKIINMLEDFQNEFESCCSNLTNMISGLSGTLKMLSNEYSVSMMNITRILNNVIWNRPLNEI